ncbi:MAG: hypothetical protein FJY86_03440 [Candidatus Diapherotrites archaeon]|uniref:Uncharacterized protein n=1 Tax=Candidatus Iainarchaeum sp. TaxID=3101447 RepID=A0A8T4C7S8_9ARCH|nr:hypothetical protein [Candidatus Diapherotrites archaeon]
MRPRIRGILPVGLTKSVAAYVRSREESVGKKSLRHLMDANHAVKVLRSLDHHSSQFERGLELVRESIAGQLALTAQNDSTLHDFLRTKKFIYVNAGSRLVGTNWPKLLGVGRDRISTADILWLMNHL